MNKELKTDILLGIFVGSIVAANLLGNKIATLFGVSFSVGIFMYPLTFLITDIIHEVYGKKKATNFVYAGFITNFIVLLFLIISIHIPPASRFTHDEEYKTIFSMSTRIIIASLIAFLVSQFHDVWAYGFWKEKTKGRMLWLRNNLSTIASQLIDTTLFMFIAFYRIAPKFDAMFIFALILPYWLLKALLAIFDTPFCYLGVKWLKEDEK